MSRLDRINHELKKAIGEILLFEVKDERLRLITVTQAITSADLKQAKVYYTVLGDEKKRADVARGLSSASGFMRQVLAHKMQMKYAPELIFYFDDTLDRSIKVEEMLDEIKDEDREED
ncbi:MAG: 30S ribosome-binding factor RbfA [Candidatus Kaelpia aquatica]|nr:30S ribosome-binding factor RbfA [Candidatus Kaelpia aquatica]